MIPERIIFVSRGITVLEHFVFTATLPAAVCNWFFEIYEPAIYTIQHNPARPYNCNEMDVIIVQHKHTKTLVLKYKGQISSVQSAERGSLVTLVTCFSPTGHFIPPLLVFPRKKY